MKANEFVKKFGLAKTRKLVQGYSNTTTYNFYDYCFDSSSGEYVSVSLSQLKRIVESHELVEKLGGLESAKKELQRQSGLRWINPETERLRVAIADVESCMEVKSEN